MEMLILYIHFFLNVLSPKDSLEYKHPRFAYLIFLIQKMYAALDYPPFMHNSLLKVTYFNLFSLCCT